MYRNSIQSLHVFAHVCPLQIDLFDLERSPHARRLLADLLRGDASLAGGGPPALAATCSGSKPDPSAFRDPDLQDLLPSLRPAWDRQDLELDTQGAQSGAREAAGRRAQSQNAGDLEIWFKELPMLTGNDKDLLQVSTLMAMQTENLLSQVIGGASKG